MAGPFMETTILAAYTGAAEMPGLPMESPVCLLIQTIPSVLVSSATWWTHGKLRWTHSLQDHNGLWHTVLDDPASYCEVSGSSAIAAGILKGIHLGILDSSYLPTAELAISAVCDNIAADGTVLNVSAGTGIGMNADHYKNIVIKPMAYGQSLAILALTEALEGWSDATAAVITTKYQKIQPE